MSLLGALPIALLALGERVHAAMRAVSVRNYLAMTDVKDAATEPRWIVAVTLAADACIVTGLVGAPAGAQECAYVAALGCCILAALTVRRG